MIASNIEKAVPFQTERLMNLKVKTNGFHEKIMLRLYSHKGIKNFISFSQK
jgi:hypothetical protein